MGLMCAYELLKKGHQVDIYEADDRIGGMSAHFDFNGLSIERFYHFVCKPDEPLFEAMDELGILDELKWVPTKMGYYYDGELYDWGNPVALLKFPRLNLLSKLRYGFHMFYCTKINDWRGLESQEASNWIKKWVGQRAYDVLWRPLFARKFHDYTDNLSAAWIWARIKRVGRSRRSLLQEELGYIDGGSERLLKHLAAKIEARGGRIHLKTPVQRINIEQEQVTGVHTPEGDKAYSDVISTIPLPFVPRLTEQLAAERLEKYRNIKNIGVVCVIFKLKRRVTDNFWLNISDPEIEIPGIVEYTNLRPLDVHIAYVPYYLPQTHPKYQWSDQAFIDEATGYLKKINPQLSDDDVIEAHASRYGFAQPICPPEFASQLPSIKTPVSGLYVADTSYYYPEDRSISESFKLGKQIAGMV
jgi:protoporphyrinogen oxidase